MKVMSVRVGVAINDLVAALDDPPRHVSVAAGRVVPSQSSPSSLCLLSMFPIFSMHWNVKLAPGLYGDCFGINWPVTITDFKYLEMNFQVNDADHPDTGQIQEF